MKPTGVTPILNVSDVPASIAWFEKLGWRCTFAWNAGGAIAEGTASNEHGEAQFAAVCAGEGQIFLCHDGQGLRGGKPPRYDGDDDTGATWMSVWFPPSTEITLQEVAADSAKQPRTFKSCAETYIAAQSPGWKSAKHAKQWTSSLTTYAYPVIGALDVGDITLEHMLLILQPIWAAKTETATRVRGRIYSILDWSTHRGYRSGKNPASRDGNLEHELPSPTKLKKRSRRHHPALPYLRIGAFMVDLRSRQGVSIRALEWGILTGSRSQEIRFARRCEIDIALKRWTIPASLMKLKKEHVVPLSDATIALYESLPVVKDCDLLFPSPEGGPLSDAALSA